MNDATAALLGAGIGAVAPSIAALVRARNMRMQLNVQERGGQRRLQHEIRMQGDRYQEERKTTIAEEIVKARLTAYADLVLWLERDLSPAIPSGISLVDSLDRAKALKDTAKLDPEVERRVFAYGSSRMGNIMTILQRAIGSVSALAMVDDRKGATDRLHDLSHGRAEILDLVERERAWVDESLGTPSSI